MKSRALLIVRATCAPEQAEAFNAWYNGEHLPDILRSIPGILRARRFAPLPDTGSEQEYLTIYEFSDERGPERFLAHPAIPRLVAEYDARWAVHSTRTRAAFREVCQLRPADVGRPGSVPPLQQSTDPVSPRRRGDP